MKGHQKRTKRGKEAWLLETLSHASTIASSTSGHFGGGKGFFFFYDWLTWYKAGELLGAKRTSEFSVAAISHSMSCCWAYISETSRYVSKHISILRYWAFLQHLPQSLITVFVPGDIKHSHYLSVLLKYVRVEEKVKINNKFHIQCILSGHQSSYLKMEQRRCRIWASLGKMFGSR